MWTKRFAETKKSTEREFMGTHSNEPLSQLSLRKSNDFITAKYNSSLLENQVMAIALTRIEVNASDRDSPLEAKLYPSELKRLVSDEAHIYRDLKKLAKTIIGHTMFLEDGKGNFKAFSIVPNADYINGIFTIKFNNELKDHVLNLEKNYTSFMLSVMTNIKRNVSFRLYEVLKKEAYKIPLKTKTLQEPYTQAEYNISELKFIMGLANADDPAVKKAIASSGRSIDWDELYEKLDKKDRKYDDWRDFARRVLKPAQEELEEKSDIRFEFEGLREGRRTKRILFTIYRNTPRNPEIIDEKMRLLNQNSEADRQLEYPMDAYIDFYEEFCGHCDLGKEDIDLLISKAGGDIEKVRRAIELADKQDYINNYMGWLIRCIEQNYTGIEVLQGSAEDAKRISSIKAYYNTNKDEIAAKVWNKSKTKDEFAGFESEVNSINYTIEQLEEIYSPAEMVEMFLNWKLGKSISDLL